MALCQQELCTHVETGSMIGRMSLGAKRDASVVTTIVGGRLEVSTPWFDALLHPLWLRERSCAEGSIDGANGQRLVEPSELPGDLAVVDATVSRGHRLAAVEPSGGIGGCGGSIEVTFSDGHRMKISVAAIAHAAHAGAFGRWPEDPPAATPWVASAIDVPLVDYRRLGPPTPEADDARLEALRAFFTVGFLVLQNTPAVPEALHAITGHFGRISPTSFGPLFNVRTEPVPVDLAYTPVALSAHTDQPYRGPTPGIQFLHTIANDAPGGASTMVDGLAAVDALAAADPEAHDLLCSVPVEFRYDIGTDVGVGRAPIIDRRPDGSLRQLRFSPRLDFAPLLEPDRLDVFYRGRRWLAEALNDSSRQIEYGMEAGDVLIVDNHRILHGRTRFDPTRGHRYLQGCYIDHDGPISEWILATRRSAERQMATSGIAAKKMTSTPEPDDYH